MFSDSGWIADRVDIRYFLSIGMIGQQNNYIYTHIPVLNDTSITLYTPPYIYYTGSGFSAILMGLAYFANIHSLSYFIIMQIIGGLMQVRGDKSGVRMYSETCL